MDPDLLLEKGQPRHAKTQAGTLPVLVTRVSATVENPAFTGMTAKYYDWHNQVIRETTLAGGRLDIPADLPVTYVVLAK